MSSRNFFYNRGTNAQGFQFLILLFAVCYLLLTVSCNDKGLLKEGSTLPDFTGITTSGDTVSLSSFRKDEKILLVNFWAAWCSDCMKHNPELAELNKHFSEKKFGGHEFEMVSISLDKDTALWKRRIVQQNLDWKNHITDLQGWESAQLKAFNVHVIPSNYLVDHTGKIICVDVSQRKMEKILREIYER